MIDNTRATTYLTNENINFVINPNLNYPYYDVFNNTIYLKTDKIDYDFYHELNHYYDFSNKFYRKVSFIMIELFESMVYLTPLILVWWLMFNNSILLSPIMVVMLFRFQEESRAHVSSLLSMLTGRYVRV